MIRTEFENGNLLDPTAKEAVKKSEREVLKKIQTHQRLPGSATSLRRSVRKIFLSFSRKNLKVNFWHREGCV